MGTYDPPSGTADTENQTANIIGALLQFPTGMRRLCIQAFSWSFTFFCISEVMTFISFLHFFVSEYTFSAVGKTATDGQVKNDEESAGDSYANEVKQVLVSVLGDSAIELRVVPRGTKFTRVTAKVTVESSSIISSIYEELDALEATVMKF